MTYDILSPMVYQSLAQMFVLQAERYRDQVLYRFVKAGCWESYTWQRALAEVRLVALGLVSPGRDIFRQPGRVEPD